MRRLLDIINDGQGEAPFNLDGFEDKHGKLHLVMTPNPKFEKEDDE